MSNIYKNNADILCPRCFLINREATIAFWYVKLFVCYLILEIVTVLYGWRCPRFLKYRLFAL